jgi:cation/acetate symporter
VLLITVALMVGTAGLPHVIVRFYTVRSVRAARWSTGWALLFIALLYTTAPTVAIFAKYFILETLADQPVEEVAAVPGCRTGCRRGSSRCRTPTATGSCRRRSCSARTGLPASIDRDIIVLALPEIAGSRPIIIALVAAGGLAAALSTASGLLIVISSAIAHDVYGHLRPDASDRSELFVGRS